MSTTIPSCSLLQDGAGAAVVKIPPCRMCVATTTPTCSLLQDGADVTVD
jgi:hypothetical protein